MSPLTLCLGSAADDTNKRSESKKKNSNKNGEGKNVYKYTRSRQVLEFVHRLSIDSLVASRLVFVSTHPQDYTKARVDGYHHPGFSIENERREEESAGAHEACERCAHTNALIKWREANDLHQNDAGCRSTIFRS